MTLFYNFLDCSHVVCLYQKSVSQFTVLVCKAVRLAFSCRTSAISFPFIPVPWNTFTINLEDGREAPSKARKKGAKRLEFLVIIKNYSPTNKWKAKIRKVYIIE